MPENAPGDAPLGGNRDTTQAGMVPAGWQFSAWPSLPGWPQQSPTNPSDAFQGSSLYNGFMDSNLDFSDEALWNVGMWEDWDIAAPNSLFSPNQFQQPQVTLNCDQIAQFASIDGQYTTADDYLNRSNTVAGTQPVPAPGLGRGRSPGRRSSLLMRTSGQTANSIPGTASLGRMQLVQRSKEQPDLKCEPLTASWSTASPRSPDTFATMSGLSSRQSEIQSPTRSQPKNRRYHKDTERQYRLRLNGRFSALLKALPDDLVESASGHSGRSEADKALTKIEILALAKSHITSLEKLQTELEEESLVLRGQQELFKRFCGGGMGGS